MKGILAKHASEPEFIFAHQALADKLPPFECEYRFDEERRFRFDFAIVEHRLAVEIDGAIWARGAHSSPMGILRDMEKLNLAVMRGWWVLRFTPAQVKSGEAIETVKKWLEGRSSEREN